jgi:DNA-binding NarL/FixJ family response regulator
MSDIKIVIVDDHKLFRIGLRQILERQHEIKVVGEASNGFDAVDIVKDLQPDLVLIDISMAQLNGIEAARKIIADNPEVKTMILSMHADRRYILESLRAGVRGYLLKDSAPEELLSAIKKVMQNQFYLSPKINEQVIAGFMQMAVPETTSPFSSLSSREREVLQLIAEGKSTHQVAEKLNVSAKTIETHRMHIMDKLNIHTIAELTRYAIREGLSPLD